MEHNTGTLIAHLRISSFSSNTPAGLDTALAAIKAQGASGIILDLRDNGGGLFNESVDVASRFISSGNVILEKDINSKSLRYRLYPGLLSLIYRW